MFQELFKKNGRFIIGFLLSIALLAAILNIPSFVQPREATWGVTFSPGQAQSLGLDWRETYQAILDDLGIRKFRLSAYWNAIEPHKGEYDFSDLDYQLEEAAKRGAQVTLAIGRKLPRWPECHEPAWVRTLSREELEQELFTYLTVLVGRYKDHPALERWQIENEILFPFGDCPHMLGIDTLKKEVALVRSLDTRAVMITDSGEWTLWVPLAWYGDVLGSSLYREAYNPAFGYIPFPIQPGYYQARALFWKLLGREVIISELQTEPWGSTGLSEMSSYEAAALLPIEKFRNNIAFAKRVGFSETYLWGVEWWYKMQKEGNDVYWNEVKKLPQEVVSRDTR